MAIGYLFERERKDFQDYLKPMKSYEMVKKLHDRFVERFGACRCMDVQKGLVGRSFNLWDPRELEEAEKFGMLDYCSTVVGTAAKIAAEIILAEGDVPA